MYLIQYYLMSEAERISNLLTFASIYSSVLLAFLVAANEFRRR